jgi:hypothetical protein
MFSVMSITDPSCLLINPQTHIAQDNPLEEQMNNDTTVDLNEKFLEVARKWKTLSFHSPLLMSWMLFLIITNQVSVLTSLGKQR